MSIGHIYNRLADPNRVKARNLRRAQIARAAMARKAKREAAAAAELALPPWRRKPAL